MCLILFSINPHPAFRFVLLANRDEYFNRPARHLHFWPDAPDILAGRDEVAGGTWLGLSRKGRFSALTNYRDPSHFRKDAPSRGQLVADFLKGGSSVEEFISDLDVVADRYNGFNLLLSDDLCTFYYYSNICKETTLLGPGTYGLSNGLLNSPWPKVEYGKERLGSLLKRAAPGHASFFRLLANRREWPDRKLPETGIGRKLEKRLSPIFIRFEEYGTRCSTVLTISGSGKVIVQERNFNIHDSDSPDMLFSFMASGEERSS